MSLTNCYKPVSLVLCAAQAFLAFPAFASPANQAVQTPEFEMLRTMIALQGEALPQGQLEQAITETTREYNSTAPAENRMERLEQALVDLRIYTPAQADALVQSARAEEARLGRTVTENQFTGAVENLARINAQGAQFSCSNLAGIGAIMTVAGGVTAVAGITIAVAHGFEGGHGYIPFLTGASLAGAGFLTMLFSGELTHDCN